MFCYNCGKKLEDNDNFCSNCGAKMRAESVIEEEKAPESEQQNEIINQDSSEDLAKSEDNLCTHSDEIKKILETPAKAESDIQSFSGLFSPEPIVFISEEEAKDITKKQKKENKNKFKKETGRGRKIVNAVCSVLMSVFIFALLLSLSVQIFVRWGVTDERLKSSFNSIDYKTVKAKPFVNALGLPERFDKKITDNATIVQAFYSCIDQRELVNPISEAEVERLFERLKLNDFLAEKASKAIKIARTGEDAQAVYANEIVDYLRSKSSYIEDTIGLKLVEVDFLYMQKRLEMANDEMLNFVSTQKLSEHVSSFNLGFIRFLCTDWFIALSAVLTAGFGVAIGFLNKKTTSAFIYTSVPFILLGALLLASGLFYTSILPDNIGSFSAEIITKIVSPFTPTLIIIGAVAASIGFCFLVTGIVLLILRKKRKSVKEITPLVQEFNDSSSGMFM